MPTKKKSDKPKRRSPGHAKPELDPAFTPRHTDKSGRKWYSDDQRDLILAALSANRGNVAKTADETGVPYSTVYAWANGHRHPEALRLRNDKGGKLSVALEEIAWLLAAVMPEKIGSAPLNHIANSLGTVIEKMRILQGLPTSYGRTENANINLSARMERLSPDERAALVAILGKLESLEPGTDGGSEGVPGSTAAKEVRYKSAGVLGPGVPDRGSIDGS
jgi:transposase-like protein